MVHLDPKMKFRGKMFDLVSIKKFYNLILTMSKLSKKCVWRLTRNDIYFILTEIGTATASGLSGAGGGPIVWCHMEKDHFFQEYHMEGVTTQQPEIYLEFEPDRLARTLAALKNSNAAKSLKIKLTRKHDCPCLSFEIELTSSGSMASLTTNATSSSVSYGGGSSRTCTHDVPVSLIPRSQWCDFREPEMLPFDVSIYLPDFKQLKHLTEKYKNLGHHFIVKANREGKMKFVLDADMINVVTHFKHLEIPQFDETQIRSKFPRARDLLNTSRETLSQTEDDFVSVRVELKRFNQFLSAEQVAPKKVIANLIGGRMIHMFLIHDDITIQYFIPGILED